MACSGFHVPLRWGHPFGSSVHTFVCARSERRFSQFFSDFKFLHDGVTLLGSSIRIHTFSIGSKELLVAGCEALALLGV